MRPGPRLCVVVLSEYAHLLSVYVKSRVLTKASHTILGRWASRWDTYMAVQDEKIRWLRYA